MKEKEESSYKNINLSEDDRYDQSRRAEVVLDHILNVDSGEKVETEVEKTIAVEDELRSRPILDTDTGRTKSRVLFLTTEEKILEPENSDRKWYLELANVFDEVHVMVLIGRSGRGTLERLANNTWFYRIHDKNWWRLPWIAKEAAEAGLTFNGSVRPDIIVATDPFEAGLAAYLIAKQFRRPWQIHIKTDFLKPDFKEKSRSNKWRVRLAKFLLKRIGSIRTSTSKLKDKISKQFKNVSDIHILPQYYQFTDLLNAAESSYLKEKYPNYSFIILAFGPLTADSYLHELFAALRKVLLNPRIGLFVVGEGPTKELFVEKVKLLGIEKSVVFTSAATNTVDLFKSADLLVEVDVSQESEVRILKAAAAGLPIVAKETDLRIDLLPDGDASYLCSSEDVLCIGEKTAKLINEPATRHRFTERSETIARDRLQEDPEQYYLSIRDTIETILMPPETGQKTDPSSETNVKPEPEKQKSPNLYN